uniref:Uncharacterized protein n=1 Tax=viral metagenome TaxID=1070528 RepID=A0A6M3LY73_9ZZZZ
MKKKDILIILGFIAIILASTIPFIEAYSWGGMYPTTRYVTLFEAIKIKILVMGI